MICFRQFNDKSYHIILAHVRCILPSIQIQELGSYTNSKFMETFLTNEEVFCEIESESIDLGDFYFYRRGLYEKSFLKIIGTESENDWLEKEEEAYWRFLDVLFASCSEHFGSYAETANSNKLENLFNARKAGLMIPATAILCSKESVGLFISSYERIIVKPVTDLAPVFCAHETVLSPQGTTIFDGEQFSRLQTSFYPTLFQQYIEKSFEVRVFFFYDQIYAMAIFSQLHEETKLDFRNDFESNLNRCVPYTLPKKVRQDLTRFIDDIQLTTGSIDLVVDVDLNHYFLEVNPVGQFDWLARNCNYNIEYEIAKFIVRRKRNAKY